MKNPLKMSSVFLGLFLCPAFAVGPTCETVLDNCRTTVSTKHCHCTDICVKAITLCENEKKLDKKHEAEALLDQCKVNCPTGNQ